MQGEERAWELLAELDPHDVCRRSLSVFDPSASTYNVNAFGMPVTISTVQRTMCGSGPDSDLVLKKMAYFSHLAILHYLVGAWELPLSGRLVKPSELSVGALYFRGSHVLPLDAIAVRYARDIGGFMGQGIRFGGERRPFGDASVELRPLPRLPVTVVLWREDDEFAARADLMFDATCERHVPADILWSVAMMSAKVMVHGSTGR